MSGNMFYYNVNYISNVRDIYYKVPINTENEIGNTEVPINTETEIRNTENEIGNTVQDSLNNDSNK